MVAGFGKNKVKRHPSVIEVFNHGILEIRGREAEDKIIADKIIKKATKAYSLKILSEQNSRRQSSRCGAAGH
jgi:hypothetical protein